MQRGPKALEEFLQFMLAKRAAANAEIQQKIRSASAASAMSRDYAEAWGKGLAISAAVVECACTLILALPVLPALAGALGIATVVSEVTIGSALAGAAIGAGYDIALNAIHEASDPKEIMNADAVAVRLPEETGKEAGAAPRSGKKKEGAKVDESVAGTIKKKLKEFLIIDVTEIGGERAEKYFDKIIPSLEDDVRRAANRYVTSVLKPGQRKMVRNLAKLEKAEAEFEHAEKMAKVASGVAIAAKLVKWLYFGKSVHESYERFEKDYHSIMGLPETPRDERTGAEGRHKGEVRSATPMTLPKL